VKKLFRTDQFIKEFKSFPVETQEDLIALVRRYLLGERLPRTAFKTFNIDKKTRIQEFKVKDSRGNWRVVSCILDKANLALIYAFHKKSQKLSEKDKKIIIKRVKEIHNE